MKFKSFYKNQKEKDVIECLELLSEASIYADKYREGSKVILKTPMISRFNKLIEKVASEVDGTPFEKVGPKKAIKVELSSGNGEVYLRHEKTKQVFHVTGSTGTISAYFNHYKDSSGINWNAQALETCQCLGFYIDGNSLLDDLADPDTANKVINTKWKSEIKKTLGNGADWNSSGSSIITNALDSMSLGDWAQLASLSAGSTSFYNKVVSSNIKNVNIVHGSIDSYYKSEESNSNIKVSGEKRNTADVILMNVDIGTFMNAIGTQKVEFNKQGLCTIGGKIKFYQISLKKAMGQAQLGKVLSWMQSKYDIPTYVNLLNIALGVNEGLGDMFSGAIETVKNLGKKVWDTIMKVLQSIKSYTSSFISDLNNGIGQQQQQDFSYLEKKMGLEKGYLTDCMHLENGELILEADSLNDRFRKLTAKEVNIILDETNERINKFQSNIKKSQFAVSRFSPPLPKFSNVPVFGELIKLFANFSAIYIYDKAYSKNLNNSKKLMRDIFEMQKEMRFGKTSLPLFKVYGAKEPGDTHTYEYLGTGEEFINKEMDDIMKEGAQILLGFRCNKDKGNYIFLSHVIAGISEKGAPNYSEIWMGTNRGDAQFSFNIEGSTTLNYERMMGKYE